MSTGAVATVSKVRVLGKKLLVLPDRPEDRTESGIHIPTASQSPQRTGVVVDYGPEHDIIGTKVDIGTRIAWLWNPVMVEVDGESYALMEAEEIALVYL